MLNHAYRLGSSIMNFIANFITFYQHSRTRVLLNDIIFTGTRYPSEILLQSYKATKMLPQFILVFMTFPVQVHYVFLFLPTVLINNDCLE